jgi:DNA-binding NtrC family response regulator
MRPRKARVLVVEDEDYVRESLVEMLEERGWSVTPAPSVDVALDILSKSPVDVVLSDLRMPGATGLDLVKQVHEASPEVPVVILTGQGSIASAVECLKAGAADYVLKPADPAALEVVLGRAMDSNALRREVRYLRAALAGDDLERPLGESAGWRRVMATIEAAAPADSPVLLTGESGTGKELLARLIHRLSHRASGPYVRVNCAAVPVEIWDSEFFGHRRGAFPGAAADREGRFRLAERGTLFLEDVGAMPNSAQAKLLRALQDGEFYRVGDDQATSVDVRIVAATSTDLEGAIKAGSFRQDLFFRLAVLKVQVPALHERPEDIPLLAARFAADVARRLGRPAPSLSVESAERLKAYSWPGNVRELQNVVERALILNPERGLEDLDLAPEAAAPRTGSSDELGDLNMRDVLNRHERELILEAQRRSKGVKKEAARLLGIDPRNLGYYLRKHNLDPEAAADRGEGA